MTSIFFCPGSNLGSRDFSEVAEIICCAHYLDIVDRAKKLNYVVDRTHSVVVRAAQQRSLLGLERSIAAYTAYFLYYLKLPSIVSLRKFAATFSSVP